MLLVAVVVVVAAVLGLLLVRPAPQPASTPPSTEGTVWIETGRVSPHLAVSNESTSTPSAATPSAVSLQGDALAQAWLRGYLERPVRTDAAWVDVIEPLTTAELLSSLRRANPDIVGLRDWASIHVGTISAIKVPGQPVNTPTRVTTTWRVELHDDAGHRATKAFRLMAYLGDGDRWWIAHVEHLVSSEG